MFNQKYLCNQLVIKDSEVEKMIARTEEDFNGLKEIGKIVASIRDELVQRTISGITTKELDDLAGELFEKAGAVSAPKVNIISGIYLY
ncbi:hypothetical protein Q0F98_37010 [Paenibacillus amylolyticus]|nr:hypothetical protein Q0F98_37010 [Paenibacillus amylolyticus]